MTSQPRLILGLVGPKGSGKSTLAHALMLDYHFRHFPFAGPLKAMLRTLLIGQGLTHQIIDQMIDGDLKEKPSPYLDGKSPRFAMQTLGTEWGRALIGPDFWINTWKHKAEAATDNVVCDDVRFLNESEAIRDLGGKIIYISRQDLKLGDAHVSEQEMKKIRPDHVIANVEGRPEMMLNLLIAEGIRL